MVDTYFRIAYPLTKVKVRDIGNGHKEIMANGGTSDG